MPKFYSATTRGFYDSVINKVMPGDVISIANEYYLELLEKQASGFSIEPDDDGRPYAKPLPDATGIVE